MTFFGEQRFSGGEVNFYFETIPSFPAIFWVQSTQKY